ncbi:MAG: glutamate-ammonia-ligase adenylyltransferase [Gammaproteobacteria bacterium]|jgi:glutamate-ammonia-ligase adenylyltransferase
MINHPEIQHALSLAWHQDTSANSLERWLELSQQENWEISVDALTLMTSLFGASWYFTRFCFYRGNHIISLFDNDMQNVSVVEALIGELKNITSNGSLDESIEQLRIRKNEIMLSILLLQLGEVVNQEKTEALLTQLADHVLIVMYRLFGLDQFESIQCSVLAMGRFSGNEMNYGSDLDLIFIENVLDRDSDVYIVNKVRKMLRYISRMDPSGALYEIDMRLRPHGSSGVLVTPLESFLRFHQTDREVWERQMMTRCRVVVGNDKLSEQVNNEVLNYVYGEYEISYLAKEIIKVRLLVEQELAGGSDKIDLKRGKGGVMDIDFLTHFFQLAYGVKYSQLRSTSTRQVLKESSKLGFINEKTAVELSAAYDFYKKSEAALRVFDMKSISVVTKDTKSLIPLARATGFLNDDHDKAVAEYKDRLMQYRDRVRQTFESIIHAAI